jgi:hypothetical protein
MDEAHEDLEGRGLARAVRSEIAEDLAPADFEVQPDEGRAHLAVEEADLSSSW